MTTTIYGASFDAVNAESIAGFWGAVLGRPVNEGATRDSATLGSREGEQDTPILFHGVPETKSVKNRVHLDLISSEFDSDLARLIGLGATEVASFDAWTTLRDPEGNEFDLIRG